MFWDWWAGGGGGWAGLAWLGGWAGGLAGFGGGQGRAKQGMQEGRAGQGSAETRFARPLQNRLKAWRERKGGGGGHEIGGVQKLQLPVSSSRC